MSELPELPDDVEMVVPSDPDTWLSDDGWIFVGMTYSNVVRPKGEPTRLRPPWGGHEIELGPGKLYYKPA